MVKYRLFVNYHTKDSCGSGEENIYGFDALAPNPWFDSLNQFLSMMNLFNNITPFKTKPVVILKTGPLSDPIFENN